jgi:hypothetical protein
VRLELRPLLAFRLHEAPVNHPVTAPYAVHAYGDRLEVVPGGDLPSLRLFPPREEKAFTIQPEAFGNVVYALEQNRGYDAAASSGRRDTSGCRSSLIRPARWSHRPSRGTRSARSVQRPAGRQKCAGAIG